MAKTRHQKQPCAWYALRRTLPLWSFEQNLKELVRCLPRYGVDELIVKVDTEEFTHGQPPYAWVKRYQPRLFRIKKAMDRLGIRFSINPWITVGLCDRGRDSRKQVPGLRTTVGHDGSECKVCACPISKAWRQHVARIWTLYAETRPHVIWVEDDIRTFNHRPVEFGCFCPDHLRLFSERAGRKVTREELVAAILQPGKPHPWRALYLDMQAELMIDTVAFLARVVHAVSPETCLGLMSSGPRVHALEGRQWKKFALAMADGKTVYSRPPMGNYSEDSMRGFYYSHDSIKITRHCMPVGTVEQTEVENVPFTQYSKSAAFTFLEMAISFAYGSHGVTMNLFDHAGTPMETESAFGCILGEKKPWLNALAERAQVDGGYRGVQLLHREKASYVKRLWPRAPYWALSEDGSEMMQTLEAHGIPTTYDESSVVATSGQILRACSDDEIRRLLAGGLFVDAVAAGVLIERGFAADIGLKSAKPPVHLDALGAFSAEEFSNRRWGGSDHCYLTLTIPHLGGRPNVSLFNPLPRAEILSWIVDPDARRVHPCMIAYRNKGGGRVVVHALAWAGACGIAFNHTFRRLQLQGAMQWLAHGGLPIVVNGGVYPLAFRKDTATFSLIGMFNLTLDAWPRAEFTLGDCRRVARVEVLTKEGLWKSDRAISIKQKGAVVSLRYNRPVPYDQPLVLTVWWQ
jgi:hypothetical protein